MKKEPRKTFKIGLICSPGGHLTEMNLLREAYQDIPHFFVTYESDNTRDMPDVYFLPGYSSDHTLLRRVGWFFQCLAVGYRVIKEQRPDLMISSGGGDVAIPIFLIGKLSGVKLLYIEHIGRFTTPSSTGQVLYWLSDRFFVQSKALLSRYGKKAEYHGAVV